MTICVKLDILQLFYKQKRCGGSAGPVIIEIMIKFVIIFFSFS